MEIYSDRGMIKFTFKYHFGGIQLDGANGKLQHVERRNSDILEHIYEAYILDKVFNATGNPI